LIKENAPAVRDYPGAWRIEVGGDMDANRVFSGVREVIRCSFREK